MDRDHPPLVSAEQVAYGYGRTAEQLRPTTLAVQRGEFWHVSGPSGAGKSTLARCLTGLIPHLYRGRLNGRVIVEGLDTRSEPLWRLAERAGLVFQNPATQVLGATVEGDIAFGLENLGLERAEIGRRVEAVIGQFGLEELRARAPHTLSGGEQQKLGLAATIARDPPLLVLDEPLSMLDSTSATQLVDHLARLRSESRAIVMCEHRADYLRGVPQLKTLRLQGAGREEDVKAASAPPSASIPPFVLRVENLRVALGGRDVVQSLSFEAKGGEIIALVGRNGAGKTTLLRALAGLQTYDGRVSVSGERPDLGLVFQNADLQLFNPSVRSEILYRVPHAQRDLYEWLVGVLELQPYQETPPLLLSEGEKKRVALACVLVRNARQGVLLDEPSLGQDAMHKARLIRLAHGLAAAGKVVFMTTHDLGLARQADRVLLMADGRFVADGPPAEIWGDKTAWQRAGLVLPGWARLPEAGA